MIATDDQQSRPLVEVVDRPKVTAPQVPPPGGSRLGGLLWVPESFLIGQNFRFRLTKTGRRGDAPTEVDMLVYDPEGQCVGLPRWCCSSESLQSLGSIQDDRTLGAPAEWSFLWDLRPAQEQAVSHLLPFVRHSLGATLEGPCGCGKTIMLIALAERLGRATLLLVHTEELLEQWRERLLASTSLTEEDVGIARGKKAPLKPFCLGLIQSLCKGDGVSQGRHPPEFYDHYGTLLVDECHRMPADTWLETPRYFPARFRIGATATPERPDRMHRAFEAHIGPVCVRIPPESVQLAPRVFIQQTGHRVHFNSYRRWIRRGGSWVQSDIPDDSRLEKALTKREGRNREIAHDIAEAAGKNRRILVLSQFTERLEVLHRILCERGVDAVLYTNKHAGSAKKRRDLQSHQVLLATNGVAEVGLDIPDLDVLFLTGPKSSRVYVDQAIGRICRDLPGKPQPVVIDYDDLAVSAAHEAAGRREKRYRERGWKVDILLVRKEFVD